VNPGPLLGMVVAGSVVFGTLGFGAAWRMRIASRADRLALRLALAREGTFVEAARRLADAARTSIEAVREETQRAVIAIAPAVDVVLFFEESEAQLVCTAAYGGRVDFFGGTRLALDDDSSLIVQALRCGHRVTAADAPGMRLMHPCDRFAAAIPLVLAAGRRCVLYVSAGEAGSDALADRIVQLVDQAAPAYRIALDRADDRARAEFDGLTGLLTARAFRLRLAATIEAARFAPLGRVGLLFVDTDRFKSWNDLYGHASGDALLRELAVLLRAAATDPADLVARNGGDEFCVVLADAEKSRAVARAERLRASIAEADFSGLHARIAGGEEVQISASIGVACFPVDAKSPEVLLERADEAMYHSKRTGRNGVSFFGVDAALVRGDGATEERSADRRRE
jgi:diguanylate cyclase (GGDEF)-like protein